MNEWMNEKNVPIHKDTEYIIICSNDSSPTLEDKRQVVMMTNKYERSGYVEMTMRRVGSCALIISN